MTAMPYKPHVYVSTVAFQLSYGKNTAN